MYLTCFLVLIASKYADSYGDLVYKNDSRQCYDYKGRTKSCCNSNACVVFCPSTCPCGCRTCTGPDTIESTEDGSSRCVGKTPAGFLGPATDCKDNCAKRSKMSSGRFKQVHIGNRKVNWITAKKLCEHKKMQLLSYEPADKADFVNEAMYEYYQRKKTQDLDFNLWSVWTSGRSAAGLPVLPHHDAYEWTSTGCAFSLKLQGKRFDQHCLALQTFWDNDLPYNSDHYYTALSCEDERYYVCESRKCRTRKRQPFLVTTEREINRRIEG